MSTTTIRMPQALRERVARTARRAGTTVHGFVRDVPDADTVFVLAIRAQEEAGYAR